MSQRNPMNERYTGDKVKGKTRKSSASAKPKAQRAATLRDPAPKTKKQKKQEAKQREAEMQQKAADANMRYEDTADYKKLRRIWWILLFGAIAVTVISVFLNQTSKGFFGENPDGLWLGFVNQATMNTLGGFFMVCAYVFIIAAFYVDFRKIRKERKIYNAAFATGTSKEARRNQKQAAANRRAAEAQAAAQQEEEPASAPEKKGFLARFKK